MYDDDNYDIGMFDNRCDCPICRGAAEGEGYPSPNMPKLKKAEPRTQKASGLLNLAKAAGGVLYPVTVLSVKSLVQTVADTEAGYYDIHLPSFARPCPKRPRHGFVESKVVSTRDELISMAKTTFEVDPDGEIMLTPVVDDVTHNAIWTPNALVVGLGHDGATAGRNTVTVPLAGVWPDPLKSLAKDCGVGPEEDPYIEVIYTHHKYPQLTQLRAGPQGAVQGNYVPTEIVVVDVLSPNNMDLLEWEKKLQSAKPGLVIYHPGGSPTDHYTAHARTFNVPVVFDHEPHIGDTLAPTGVEPYDPDEVLRGAASVWKLPITNQAEYAARLMILSAHHMGVMTGKGSFWLGVGIGLMVRLGLGALNGEARHCQNLPNADGTATTTNNKTRAQFWEDAWNKPTLKVPSILYSLTKVFAYGSFQSKGFGGLKWAQCGIALFPLVSDLGNLARATTDSDRLAIVNNLCRSFNIAIHQAHNGGWWMNKFIAKDIFDYIQQGRPQHIIQVGPMCYKLAKDARSLRSAKYIFKSWTMPSNVTTDFKSAELGFVPLWNSLNLILRSSDFEGGSPRQLPITIDLSLESAFLSGDLKLVKRKDRWAMIDSKSGTVFWTEPDITPQSAE